MLIFYFYKKDDVSKQIENPKFTSNLQNPFREGFISGCLKNKDANKIIEIYGEPKGSSILKSYCGCRADFIIQNLSIQDAENIYYGKQNMDAVLFETMEQRCVAVISNNLNTTN